LTELTPGAARSGEILLDGQDVHALPDTRLRSRVAMVFQQPNPFPMSIFDNVAFALREQSRKRPRRREIEPQVVDALGRAGLYEEVREDLDRPALRLSGGQQQRLCIARAIAMGPEVLLMDEPCSALDPISTAAIERLIGELRRDLAVVIVTHNLAQARRVADKVAFMYLGDLVEYGTVEQVFEAPRAERTREYVRGAFG
jgi:phosphate transport system ATP-binding protein